MASISPLSPTPPPPPAGGGTFLLAVRMNCAPLYDHIHLKEIVFEKRLLSEVAVINGPIVNGEVTNIEWLPRKGSACIRFD